MADASQYNSVNMADQRLKKNRPIVGKRFRPNTSGPNGRPTYDHTMYNFGHAPANSTQVQKRGLS